MIDLPPSPTQATAGNEYRPIIFNTSLVEQADKVLKIIKNPQTVVHDSVEKQIEALIKIQNADTPFDAEAMRQKILKHLNGIPAFEYGRWVFYPWNNTLVHLLGKEEFIRVRTARNLYKITPEELQELSEKKIAIIGLSVGQAIAQTIATERICGRLHLADFDNLELSNLNRLNAGVADLGLPKVVIAARKIAEMDPYIDVKCWPEGITENNIDKFLTGGGPADVLVEECDDLYVKILCRLKARQWKIPVITETNDKGMLDVERFDLEEHRGIFHHQLPEFDAMPPEQLEGEIKNLSFEQKVGYLSRIIGWENVSNEMKFSLSQLNKTITGWPQVASAVVLGAAMVTDTCRKLLLGKHSKSGRYFVQFDELIK